MKYIQLKDPDGEKMYPYVKWDTVQDKPTIQDLLKAISGYNSAESQVLTHDALGNIKWVSTASINTSNE